MVEFRKIEAKWQKKWADERLGEAEPDKRKKFFMIFAYPGISGYLHVGHMRGFSYTDMICRFKRMQGFNVLFPLGTHASGNQAIAFANKIKNKDKAWISYLKTNGCPANLIPQLTDERRVVDYFNDVYVNEYWKKFGFLADFRRFTSTIYQDYNKFIQWQFKKLNDNNLLVQKPYFATFCPECGPVAVDPSETDISKGGNAEKNEYTLLKFKFGDAFLVAATLRPETVFGQTNLWVNPDAEYSKVEVGDEVWIMSKQAGEKLAYQKDDVKTVGVLKGTDLIGKFAVAPAIERELMILPSSFTDPNVGSGLVTSVPSDAPYDWIALHDLQNDEKLIKKYKLKAADVKAIKPISIITSKGFGDHPAIEICKKMGITSQKDTEKLEKATKEIYKAGFHTGVMKDNCGKYKGKRTEEAKELMKQELIESGQADVFHDLSEEVICRCGATVVIKRIDDQWFIKYSDSKLTAKSKDCASQMLVRPDAYNQNITRVLDWFMDRACARLGNWIGTKLSFDDKWIVEPISDSTLYPAYYVVSKYVNDERLAVDQLTEEFFDYVFLGKGKKDAVAKVTNVSPDLLDQIKEDFDYWYPLDLNLGGKEHQTVHFPVFIMNHVAILDKKFWPKGIFVNYWIIGKGSKISKSKGGAEPIPDAIEKYSVDGMRLYYAHIGSPHVDVEWDESVVKNYKNAIERIYTLVEDLMGAKGKDKQLDTWLTSRSQECIKNVSASMENLDLREATTQLYFQFYDDLRWYLRRGGGNQSVVKGVLGDWITMLTPFTPHIAEELWNKLKHKGLVSVASWPSYNEKKIDLGAESQEKVLNKVILDVQSVMKLAKIAKPKEVMLFTATPWKYDLIREVKKQISVTRDIGQIMKQVMQDENIKKNAKDVNKIILGLVKNPTRIPAIVGDAAEEFTFFENSAAFLSKEIGCKVKVIKAEESKETKAGQAMPGKPAVLVK